MLKGTQMEDAGLFVKITRSSRNNVNDMLALGLSLHVLTGRERGTEPRLYGSRLAMIRTHGDPNKQSPND